MFSPLPSPPQSSTSQEKVLLQQELEKAQDLLQQSQRDCQDLGTKYITVSERVRTRDLLDRIDIG